MDRWETVFDSSSGDTATAAEIIDEFVGSRWEVKFFLKEVPRNSFRSMIQKSVEDRPLMEGYVFNDSEIDLLWGLYQEYPERKHSIKTEKAFQQIRQYMLSQAAQYVVNRMIMESGSEISTEFDFLKRMLDTHLADAIDHASGLIENPVRVRRNVELGVPD